MIATIPTDEMTGDSLCAEHVIHAAAVRRARAEQPTAATASRLADLFGALADPTRVRLVAALVAGEMCVCDLAATLGLSQSAVSHQLRLLRHLGLVRARRAGRIVYYALDDEHVLMLFRQGLDHVAHGQPGRATAAHSA